MEATKRKTTKKKNSKIGFNHTSKKKNASPFLKNKLPKSEKKDRMNKATTTIITLIGATYIIIGLASLQTNEANLLETLKTASMTIIPKTLKNS